MPHGNNDGPCGVGAVTPGGSGRGNDGLTTGGAGGVGFVIGGSSVGFFFVPAASLFFDEYPAR